MKRLSDFLIEKKYLVLFAMLALTVICAVLAFTVNINTDMTKYLPDDSSMKKGIDLMAEEFPDMQVPKTIRVMFEDMSADDCEKMLSRLEDIEYVSSVDFDIDSADYYKDGYALFILSTDYDYGSPEERSIEKTVEKSFDEHNMLYKNDNTVTTDIPLITIVIAVVLIFAVLEIMCSSWFEPVLYLVAIGCAVVINLGTNCIFKSISYITFAMAALLQLVLSMDYSVILMSRYRQELSIDGNKSEAMKRAVVNAFSSITASSVTTFVGLLALVFMSFKIGADLGYVLAKGVICSLLCVFTVLPALILHFETLIEKTAKRTPNIRLGKLAKFSYRSRYILAVLFIPLFIGMFLLQQNTDTAYTLTTKDPIADIFPKTSTLVIVYSNEDEAKIAELSDSMEADENVQTVLNYSTTLGKKCTPSELADTISALGSDMAFDPSLLNIVYYEYFDGSSPSIPAGEFLRFIANDVVSNEAFSDYIDDSMRSNLGQIEKFSSPDALNAPQSAAYIANTFGMTEDEAAQLILYYKMQSGEDSGVRMTLRQFADFVANDVLTNETYTSNMSTDLVSVLKGIADPSRLSAMPSVAKALISGGGLSAYEMASLLGMSQSDVNGLYWLYLYNTGGSEGFRISIRNFVDFLDDHVLTNPQYSSMIDAESASQLKNARRLIDAVASGQSLDAQSMASVLSGFGAEVDEGQMELLYLYYASAKTSNPEWKLSILDVFNFTANDMMNDPRFASFIPEDLRAQIGDYKTQMEDGVNQLVGKNHSIFTLYSWYPAEGEETTKFYDDLSAWCDENLAGDYYLIGDSAMSWEMEKSFNGELLSITLLTAAAIFIVVLITFRNFFVPLILVMLVQCGVFLTVAVVGWQGYSIYYLALLIVQCILMGATIDYGILLTNYYREKRETMNIRDSIKAAYEGSINTVLTSGIIMVFVCALVAPTFGEPTVNQICRTISIGAFCAIMLIVFILPSLLGTFDRFVCKKGRRFEDK